MKKILWLLGGLCAAATGFLVLDTRRVEPLSNASLPNAPAPTPEYPAD